jgi:predicted esterase
VLAHARTSCLALALALAIPLAPRRARAQDSAAVRGTLTETVTLRGDSTQTAAIYLPSAYGGERRWPVLFLMDPRGRALVPLELFRDAAERYGYILISSYNTLSDGPPEPNVRALDAMLQEVQERFAVDDHRFYLAGFSGTARVSWEFAFQLAGNVAGVIGAGAGLSRPVLLLQVARMKPAPFAFYGTAGRTDFNYEEVRALDDRLDDVAIPHHVEYFDAGHQWMPRALATRGVEWMELQAMRTGLRPRDQALIDSLRSAWLGEAAALESTQPTEAWRAYVRVANDFAGLGDVADARARADALEKSRVVRQARERSRELAARDSAYGVKLVEFLREVRARPQPLAVTDVERALELDALLRDAAHRDDPLGATAAQRQLERAFVYLAFYEPRAYLDAGQQRRAIALLRAASRIKPDNAQVCLMLTRAYSDSDDPRRALESLECAVQHSRIGAAQLEQEPSLARLRGETGFQRVLDRLRAEGRP